MTTGIKAVDTFLDVTEENHRQPSTDVTVVVGKETFECHKSVLDSWSQYFRAVFTSPMSEQKDSKVRIEEGDYVTAESFQLILTYMYSGKIDISEKNLIGILRTAHYLQMTKIIQLCKEFIEENNALSISRRVVLHVVNLDFPDLRDVQNSAMNHLTRHLSEYIINEEFGDLKRVLLERLLDNDEVGAWDENQIFVAVLEWLLKDEDRDVYGDLLLSKVRLGCVSAAKLRLVRQHVGLLSYLTTVEPIIMDMVVSSVLEENGIGECKERYPEMYRKRKYLAAEHLERLVPVYLQPEGDAYYWDNTGWVLRKLGLEDCATNIAVSDQTLYYISKSDCLMSRSMHSRKWTLVSRLPEMTSEQNPGGWSKYFLVCLGSYVYILSTGLSMQYDIKNKTLHLFDTMLNKWDYINQAAASYSSTDPLRPVIAVAGIQYIYDGDDRPLLAIGDPHNGWTVSHQLDNIIDCYGDPGSIGLTVSKEDNSILALGKKYSALGYWKSVVFSLSLSNLPNDATENLPEWQKVPTSRIGGISLVTCTRNKYSIFKNMFLPFPSKTPLLNVEELRYNPQFVEGQGQRDPAHEWRSNLRLLPKWFLNMVYDKY